jgi:hypothetical protein
MNLTVGQVGGILQSNRGQAPALGTAEWVND